MGTFLGKKVLVFDWDGTLFDSMATKLRTFSETLAELAAAHVHLPLAELQERIATVYRQLSGIPRRRIFIAALEELGLGPDAISFEVFDTALRGRNQRELLEAPLFPDAEAFLERLQGTGYQLYISSSVPQNELEFLTSRRLPMHMTRRLSGVFGSDGGFSKGPTHIARVLQETHAEAAELLFFGDDRADAELAEQAGIQCVLIDRQQRFAAVAGLAGRVPDFVGLIGELADG